MNVAFVDTAYLIALLNPRDDLHEKAVAVFKGHAGQRSITTEMVLVELMNALADDGPVLRGAAVSVVERLRDDPNVELVPQTSRQFRDAMRRCRDREDKEWSLTDCASFLVMESLRIKDALTHDHHFEEAGFRALLRV